VNAGHTRANAFVGRTVAVGDGHEPKLFNVWAAKAFAGISLEKHLPDATMSRGIVFVLRRKLPHEPVSRLRHADKDSFNTIAAKLARFAYDYSKQVRTARPVLPDDLSDRAQDNWEALFAIAECAGPDWVKRATVAALKLSSAGEESVSTGNELLADIRDVFERMGAFKQKDNFKISTVDLIAALVADEDSAWATYNRGKPLSPRQLAKQLSAYGIKPRTVRTDQKSDEKKSRTPKGYYGSEFEDAFARYLAPPEKLPPQRNDSQNVNGGGVAHDTHPKRNELAAPEALPKLDCGGVADESPVVEGGPDAGSENVF
jgi:putative DNA primase/helicase